MTNTATNLTPADYAATVLAEVTADNAGDLTGIYAGADRATKAALRAATDRAMKAALGAGDIALAVALNAAHDSMKSTTSTDRPATDYRQLVADRIANLRLAANLIESGAVRPAGVPDDTDLTDLPDGATDDNAARALGAAKVARSTDRHDIAAAIIEVTGTDPERWFTMSDIARMAGLPSAGAVAARLFRTDDNGQPVACTVPGVVTRGADGSVTKAVRQA